jgi:sporulation protein YlmC with PRC-barrel domain
MEIKNRLAGVLLIVSLALAASNLRAQQERQDESYGRSNARLKTAAAQGQLRASQIIGMDVKNAENENLGNVQDLIVDFDAYTVPYAIISHGGALGVGRTKTAIPMSALQCSSTQSKTLILPATKEQLRAASKTPTGAWAHVSDAEWTRTVDGFYSPPDGFERQPLEGRPEYRQPARAPTEQKGAELLVKPTDTTLSQQVQAAIEQQVPSQTAQNIQVTVDDGVVSLSGRVDNQTDKQNIDSSVRAIPGVKRVENLLNVNKP